VPASLRGTRDSIAARIEDASLSVAQPSQQSFYDGWLLRYSPGKAKRARSINAIGAGTVAMPEKIAYCTAFYQRHQVPCLFRITPFSQPDGLDEALDRAGFHAYQDTRVMKLTLARAAVPGPPRVKIEVIDVQRFATVLGGLHGLDPDKTRAERDRFARSPAHSVYVAGVDAGVPVACGSVAVEGTLAGIFGMVTAPTHRGQGIAASLVADLLTHARRAGATLAYLQVEADNAAARRVYTKFGFEDCYAYWYRTRSEGEGQGGVTPNNSGGS
jgi:GNAT superfamily N-acetyltransferase